MKTLMLLGALTLAVIAPAAATAQEPTPSDFKNAAKYCKALKAASGSNFASMFGTRKNAYGKCVSSTAKKEANEDATQEEAAQTNAAKECKAEGAKPLGRCVSQKAKQKKAEADEEDEAQEQDRLNAAKTCKAAKKADADQFAEAYGSRRNAFGKCVSRTAKQLAAERKAEDETPAP
jgi:hypothetical protein